VPEPRPKACQPTFYRREKQTPSSQRDDASGKFPSPSGKMPIINSASARKPTWTAGGCVERIRHPFADSDHDDQQNQQGGADDSCRPPAQGCNEQCFGVHVSFFLRSLRTRFQPQQLFESGSLLRFLKPASLTGFGLERKVAVRWLGLSRQTRWLCRLSRHTHRRDGKTSQPHLGASLMDWS